MNRDNDTVVAAALGATWHYPFLGNHLIILMLIVN